MPRQRPVVHRMMLAGGLAATLAAAAVVMSLTFASDSAAAETGTGTQRVSVSRSGAQAEYDSSEPAISADGRYVAFTTDEPFDPLDKIAASQGSTGGTASESTPDTDVYVRDTELGTTTLISHGVDWSQTDGSQPPDVAWGHSDQPSISGDGRFVAFRTTAHGVVGRQYKGHAIVVCDRDPDGDGTLDATCRQTPVSDPDEREPQNPHLSADGRRVSYDGNTDLPPIEIDLAPTEAAPKAAAVVVPPAIYVGWVEIAELRRDDEGRLVAPADDDRTYLTSPERLTIGDVSSSLTGQGDSTMAAGGTFVAFVATYVQRSLEASATVVQGYDLNTGELTRLDLDESGRTLAESGRVFRSPALSGDGRRYAFSDRPDGERFSVRLYDRDPDGDGTFGAPTVSIASRDTDGAVQRGDQAAFSADGRYLAFTTSSPGMHNGTDHDVDDEGGCLGGGLVSYCDVVIRDVVVDAAREATGLSRLPAELASPSAGCVTQPKPCEGTGDSGRPWPTGDGSGLISEDGAPVLSANGSVLAYGSDAPDLIDGGADTNEHVDVFRRRLAPALAADPQEFGQVPIGAETIKEVALTHVGAGPLRVLTVTVDDGDFTVFPGETCTTAVLHATERCLVSIRFRPTVVGARTGVLRVTFEGGETPLTVSLTGTGTGTDVTGPGVFAAAPAALDFGARPVLRTSAVKSVTVRNTGTGTLGVRAVALSATTFRADFRITADGCANRSLPAGGTCRIDVRHRPTAVGVRPATLTVGYQGSADTALLTFPVALTGEGAAPTLTSSPTVTPAGRVIQITGTGFPAGSTAKLSLTGMPGTTTAKARADGSFQVPFVVLPNTWTGRHPLNADVLPATAHGLGAPLRATLEFVIVPGSPVPPDFGTRK